MCSTTAAQLARICRAIEELAGHPGRRDGPAADGTGRRDGAAPTGAARAGGHEDDAPAGSDWRADTGPEPGEANPQDALADRLAEIWAMIAEADPELAKRVPGYLTAAD
ncbi:MAG TPA: hypothetical protein VGG16_14400 [Streptosporangiaceae bacterium]